MQHKRHDFDGRRHQIDHDRFGAVQDKDAYKKLFVLSGKEPSADEFRTIFAVYGEVEDVVRMQNDRNSTKFKGVSYVTFSKASEAALAIEELNGRMIGSSTKPLKVMLASDKKDGIYDSKIQGHQSWTRLFIQVDKALTRDEIKKTFSEYGTVDYVLLLKDKTKGLSRGMAFVNYARPYHCALALERCDPCFKAVFAAPRENERQTEKRGYHDRDDYDYDGGNRHGGNRHGGNMHGGNMYDHGDMHGGNMYGGGNVAARPFNDGFNHGPPAMGRQQMAQQQMGQQQMPQQQMPQQQMPRQQLAQVLNQRQTQVPPSPLADLLGDYPSKGPTCLDVRPNNPSVTQEHIHSLLNLIPGLMSCVTDASTGISTVWFKYPQCAAYAKEKLHALDYPGIFKISVRNQPVGMGVVSQLASTLTSSIQNLQTGQGDVQSLVETIKQATSILNKTGHMQAAPGSSVANFDDFDPVDSADEERVAYCDVPLPKLENHADKDSPVVERLYIVMTPNPVSPHYLTNVLCRFGNLIHCYILRNKNFAFAKYATKESAQRAMDTLNGSTICGMSLKVVKADPPKNKDKDNDKDKTADMEEDTPESDESASKKSRLW